MGKDMAKADKDEVVDSKPIAPSSSDAILKHMEQQSAAAAAARAEGQPKPFSPRTADVILVDHDGKEYPAKILGYNSQGKLADNFEESRSAIQGYARLSASAPECKDMPTLKATGYELNYKTLDYAGRATVDATEDVELKEFIGIQRGERLEGDKVVPNYVPVCTLSVNFGSRGALGKIWNTVNCVPFQAIAARLGGTANRKYFKLLALVLLMLCGGAMAIDTGAVSDQAQVWAGKKTFAERSPVTTTMTGDVTLNKNSGSVQYMDPNGSNRNVTFGATIVQAGTEFFIINKAADAHTLTLKNASAVTVGTISQNAAARAFYDGTNWTVFAFTAASGGVLTADGTTTGATSQAQVFTDGITLSPTTNQATLGAAGHVTVISSTAPAAASQTVTIPDLAGSANFVFDGTFANAASNFAALTLPNTTNQLTLGGASHTTILSATAPAAASQTITLPDPGAAANVIYDVKAQNITGTKTFSKINGVTGAAGICGTATANGTTNVTVSTTAVTTSSIIILTWGAGTPAGFLYVTGQTNGTSFTFKSSNAGDTTQTVNWLIIN